MREEDISNIDIGPAFLWNHDEDGRSTHEPRLATGHHVNGMTPPLEADIVAGTGGRDTWGFKPWRSGIPVETPGHHYKSKQEALDGLRDWLRSL
jgi:hypothetical protein